MNEEEKTNRMLKMTNRIFVGIAILVGAFMLVKFGYTVGIWSVKQTATPPTVVSEQQGAQPMEHYLLGPKRGTKEEAEKDLEKWLACTAATAPNEK